MNLRLQLRVWFCAVAIFGSVLPIHTPNQVYVEPFRVLQIRTDDFEIDDKNTLEIVREISRRYGVPMGVEISPRDDLHQRTTSVRIKAGTLEDVLGAAIDKNLYKWEVSDEVVNIIPTDEHRDPFLREILETRLSSLSMGKSYSTHTLRSTLSKDTAFRSALQKHGLTLENEVFTSRDSAPLGKRLKTDFTEVSIRTLLNTIVKDAHPSKYWIINRYGANREFLLINL